jgi:hypothetical protein|tara:strand:- start:741 stop:1001 length:261 start_codon:yes stop_codon:yes gene_type:complete
LSHPCYSIFSSIGGDQDDIYGYFLYEMARLFEQGGASERFIKHTKVDAAVPRAVLGPMKKKHKDTHGAACSIANDELSQARTDFIH